MINLNKLDKEKQPAMSSILKLTVFVSGKIKIEPQEGYDKNLLRSVLAPRAILLISTSLY